MIEQPRSRCPVNLSVELVGDRWTLLVLRDILFAGRETFNALQEHSEEGIATSVLADRLRRLVAEGVLVREADPAHKQKVLYRPTPKGLDLVPVLAALAAFAAQHLDPDPDLVRRIDPADIHATLAGG
ncbi:winged helix-turn-helix transcriptional regulator [Microbacterium ureisolvens]|uniref:winged helix-turn-helix transcriptional regulator n=1 Tax=Microbacterium ureisolvens TaxID=2781186 RepID=UPI0036416179